MLKLRKGPVCEMTVAGRPCGARVSRLGERCRGCLERQATSDPVEGRRQLACDPSLPATVFELLGADPDDVVRFLVARREDCPLVVLEGLEHDRDPQVRAAAAAGLSTALMPRLLQEPEDGHLFTQAELHALSSRQPADGRPAPLPADPAPFPAGAPLIPADPAPLPADPARRRAGPASSRVRKITPAAGGGLDEVLGRLEGLSARLGALHASLASTGERLGALREGLGELDRAPTRPATSLLPAFQPAELGTGPVIRADIVAAAWLAVLPVLARQRARQLRAATVAGSVAGPFTGVAGAVAELPPGPPAPSPRDLWRRRRFVHARRRTAHP